MRMSAKAKREFAERHAIPLVPPDHPEFKSGPLAHFLPHTSSQSGRKRSASTTPAGNTSAEQHESKTSPKESTVAANEAVTVQPD
jgi:hypothetical protein